MNTNFEYTIIIPIYNEISTIENVITKILKLKYPAKIIIVDDGSSDGSENLELEIMGTNITHHKSKKNMGKGNAIRTGLSLMSSEKNSVAIFFDGDDEIPTSVIEQIMKTMNKIKILMQYLEAVFRFFI